MIDCSNTIVMPGFVTTHHHQYETLQRSIIADGLLAGAWPQETYGSVVQSIWTAGRIADPADPNKMVWDLGRVPYDPEDCYIAQLVACLSEISQGITTGTDTSQANHTPEHTDAMIKAQMDSGRRMVFAYPEGSIDGTQGSAFEFPGRDERHDERDRPDREDVLHLERSVGDARLRRRPGSRIRRCALYRMAARSIVRRSRLCNHVVGNPMGIVNAAADARNGTDWSDVTFIHATRWQDTPRAQIGVGASGYRTALDRKRGKSCRDRGAHVSIANLIEMQMRHGMPPFQEALNHGILPSLSPDVDSEHDHRPVFADARRLLPAARAGERPRIPGEQPWRAARSRNW